MKRTTIYQYNDNKHYKTALNMWQRLVTHHIEADRLTGVVTYVAGEWDWYRMTGRIAVTLEDCTPLGCVSTHNPGQGGEM